METRLYAGTGVCCGARMQGDHGCARSYLDHNHDLYAWQHLPDLPVVEGVLHQHREAFLEGTTIMAGTEGRECVGSPCNRKEEGRERIEGRGWGERTGEPL